MTSASLHSVSRVRFEKENKGKRLSTLIVISCSARKLRSPRAPIPAIERYDGVFYRLLRKARRDGHLSSSITLVILSAKYGVLSPQTLISSYDQQMIQSRLAVLRPGVQRRLKQILRQKRFDRVYINLGRAYAPLIAGIDDIDNGIWASGGIGMRAQILKKWLHAESPSSERSRALI